MRATITTVKGNTYFLDKLISITCVNKSYNGELSFDLIFEGDDTVNIFINPIKLIDEFPVEEFPNEDKMDFFTKNKFNIDKDIKLLLIGVRQDLLNVAIENSDNHLLLDIITVNLKKSCLEVIKKYLTEDETTIETENP